MLVCDQVLHDGLPASGLWVCSGADVPRVRGNLLRAPQLLSTSTSPDESFSTIVKYHSARNVVFLLVAQRKWVIHLCNMQMLQHTACGENKGSDCSQCMSMQRLRQTFKICDLHAGSVSQCALVEQVAAGYNSSSPNYHIVHAHRCLALYSPSARGRSSISLALWQETSSSASFF